MLIYKLLMFFYSLFHIIYDFILAISFIRVKVKDFDYAENNLQLKKIEQRDIFLIIALCHSFWASIATFV